MHKIYIILHYITIDVAAIIAKENALQRFVVETSSDRALLINSGVWVIVTAATPSEVFVLLVSSIASPPLSVSFSSATDSVLPTEVAHEPTSVLKSVSEVRPSGLSPQLMYCDI